jgi:hypothetical protein
MINSLSNGNSLCADAAPDQQTKAHNAKCNRHFTDIIEITPHEPGGI